jgi:hypothetical protein
MVAMSAVIAVAFAGCKGGDEEDSGDDPSNEGTPAAAAPAAPPKPPPVNSVKLVKKWPAGQSVTFSKGVSIKRQVLGPQALAATQERKTTYTASFAAGAASLAATIPLKIVGQKMNNTVAEKPFIVFEGSGGGDGEEEGAEAMDDPDAGGGGGARPNPTAEAVKRSVLASLDSTVQMTYDAAGAVTKVDGLPAVHGKVLRGVPRGLIALIGGMFSETVFREAPLFHAGLNDGEVTKDANFTYAEKGMLLLNWQQDFNFTNTFTGMEEWQGKPVAAFRIIGGISGTTTRPAKVNIAPGGQFTGKALYSPDLGILVERTINGSFVATEGANTTVSNAFSQTFQVTSVGSGGETQMQ